MTIEMKRNALADFCLLASGWSVGWVDGVMGLRVGFININDMYNNDVGKGGVRVYEAYEVK
jgi:hypothetical protein